MKVMGGYVENMRKYVGKAPLMLVAACAIIYDGRKILLQRRGDNGKWSIHGGCLELGETVEDAVKRELEEEIGITPLNLEFYGVFSGEDTHGVYPNGDEVYCVCVVYLCSKYEGELSIDNCEVKELKWFDIDELPEDINEPADKAILKNVKKVLLNNE